MRYGLLRVISPDGRQTDYPLNAPSLTIGSSPENVIVIPHASVAARHARLTIDSGMPMIEDLGSEQGVYVGGRRIGPGERALISADSFRIGGVQVSYRAPGTAASTASSAVPGTAAAAAPTNGARLTVELTGPAGPCEPGSSTTIGVEIQNRGSTVEEVTFALEGNAARWAEVPASTAALLPGARQSVSIIVRPPRSHDAHAGNHDLTVIVQQRSTGQEHRATTNIVVARFAGISLSLAPMRSDRNFRVTVENTGNAPAEVALRGEDDEGTMLFDFRQIDISVPPGGKETIPLQVKLPGAPRFGREQIKGFRVEGRPKSGAGDPQQAPGQLRVKPPLEVFKLPVLILAAVLALAVGGVTYATRCESWGLPGCRDNGVPIGGPGETQVAGETPPADVTVTTPPPTVDNRVTQQAGNVETPTPMATGGEPTASTSEETVAPGEDTPTPTPNTTTPTVETDTPTVVTDTPTVPPVTPQPGTLRFDKADLVLDPEKNYQAIVETTRGTFSIGLDVRNAFETSNSFAFLATKGFYNGMPFAGGDSYVENGRTTGEGAPGAGYTQEAEYTSVQNVRGTVGMVPLQTLRLRPLGAPITVSSEWYVNRKDNFQFDTGGFAGVSRPIFGAIRSGQDVVDALTTDDHVVQIEIVELSIRPGLIPVQPILTPVFAQ